MVEVFRKNKFSTKIFRAQRYFYLTYGHFIHVHAHTEREQDSEKDTVFILQPTK